VLRLVILYQEYIIYSSTKECIKTKMGSHSFLGVEYDLVYQIALLYYNFKKFAVEVMKRLLFSVFSVYYKVLW